MGLLDKIKSGAQRPQAGRGDSIDGSAGDAENATTGSTQKSSKGFKMFGSKKTDSDAGQSTGLRRQGSDDAAAQRQQAPPMVPTQARSRQVAAQDVVGRFCGLPAEDWNGILDFADMLCTSEQASKDAAEAIRKEFKHGSPQAQERASKLLVVLMRNTTDRFKLQIASKKFIKQMQDTFENKKTEPRVKAMMFKAIAVLAYECHDDADLQPIVMLYVNIKPADAPLDGIPLEEGDTTFVPFTERASRSSRRNRNGFDPTVQLEQLMQRISVARAEAGMLEDSLAYTSPEEVGKSEIVQEFYAKALAWQDFVVEQLPWAQAEADKAHQARETVPTEQRQQQGGNTREEALLDGLLHANGEITEALAHYHRLEQQAERRRQEEDDLIAATERSKQETRHQEEPATQNGLSAPLQPVASSSGSSRSQTPAPPQQQQDSSSLPRQPATDAFASASSPERTPLKSRNPYARLSEAGSLPHSPSITQQGYLVDEPDEVPQMSPARLTSNNPFLNGGSPRVRADSGELPVPREPSAKALGKLRRVSGQPVDAEEQQKRLEEQLRRRYEEDFERSRNGTPANPGQASTAASASAPASSALVAQQQPQKSILDEYDPFRA